MRLLQNMHRGLFSSRLKKDFWSPQSEDGAKVWISSRKEENVERALDELRSEELDVEGKFSKLLAHSCYMPQ